MSEFEGSEALLVPDFPPNPALGEEFTINDVKYRYCAVKSGQKGARWAYRSWFSTPHLVILDRLCDQSASHYLGLLPEPYQGGEFVWVQTNNVPAQPPERRVYEERNPLEGRYERNLVDDIRFKVPEGDTGE